jgi:tRNA(Ile)-lysidine synthase
MESRSASVDWNGLVLHYFNGLLYLTRRLDESAGEMIDWDLQQCELGKNGLRLEIHKGVNSGLDPASLRGKSVSLVWRKGGERITLPGRKHSSTLKKLFQQKAIPTWERNALPLLMVDGEVAWAYGVGASAACCCDSNKKGINLRFVATGASSD